MDGTLQLSTGSRHSVNQLAAEIIKQKLHHFDSWPVHIIFILLFFNVPAFWQHTIKKEPVNNDNYYCRKSENVKLSDSDWINISHIYEHGLSGGALNRCFVWDIDYNNSQEISDLLKSERSFRKKRCEDWYCLKNDKCEETVTLSWNLFCHRKGFADILRLSFLGGVVLGGTPVGMLSDGIGRQLTIRLLAIFLAIASVLQVLMPSFWLFALTKFVLGVLSVGVRITSLVLSWELKQGHASTIAANLHGISGSIALFIAEIFSGLVPNWKQNSLLGSAPTIILSFIIWGAPESPIWLLAKGSKTEFVKFFIQAAIKNKIKIEPDIEQILFKQSNCIGIRKKISFKVWLRSAYLRNTLLVMYIAWYGLNFIYYQISSTMSAIIKNKTLSAVYLLLADLLANTISSIILLNAGRKRATVIILLSGSIITMVAAGTSTEYAPQFLIRVIVTTGVSILPTYLMESIPTQIRNTALGLVSSAAALSEISALYIHKLESISSWLVLGSAGIATLVAALSALSLQDSTNSNIDLLKGLDCRRPLDFSEIPVMVKGVYRIRADVDNK